MKNLTIYSREQISELTNDRIGAVGFGTQVKTISGDNPLEQELNKCEARYVVFGIVEDMGVRANFGRPGAKNAWKTALRTLLNVQTNRYNNSSEVLVLGHLDFTNLDPTKNSNKDIRLIDFHGYIVEIDRQVAKLVETIVASGKIPIAVGGGHNNAYGMLKGSSLGIGKPMNVVNIDAHTDLRPCDYRHSGNGFSYAYSEGFLKRYFIFGLHENYITQSMSDKMEAEAENIHFSTYDEMCIREERNVMEEAIKALEFVSESGTSFGIEIDCDVIENIPSSALTPSGFSVETVRKLNYLFSRSESVTYLHICEAAPDKDKSDEMIKVGKLITYLITDFIR